jgi:hypothetical protein
MDIKNTVCLLSDLTQEQIDSLRAAMPTSRHFMFHDIEPLIGFSVFGNAGTWTGNDDPAVISYDEMMHLLTGKSMIFTKTDLIELAKNKTVFVRYRKGDYRIYLDGIFNGEKWSPIDEFNEDLKCMTNKGVDIMSVYTCNPRLPLFDQLKGKGLTQIWERTELTPAQQEMEVLQAKMDELQEQMKVVQAKL